MIVYAVVDTTLSPTFPLGDALEVYVRREDADRFIEEVEATSRSSRPDLKVRPEPALAEPSRSGLPSSGLAVIRIGAAIGSFIGSRLRSRLGLAVSC